MCRAYQFRYRYCNHRSQIEYRFCAERDTTCTSVRPMHGPSLPYISLCGTCWSQPRRVLARLFRRRADGFEVEEHSPEMAEAIKKWWVRIRSDERMKLNPSYDLRAFGGLTTPKDRLRLKKMYIHLVVDILWRIQTPVTRGPWPMFEMMVILQINHYLEETAIADGEWFIAENREENAKALFTPEDPSTLAEEDQECSICMVTFGWSKFGEPEDPCRAPCGHLFGSRCIQNWVFRKQDTVPKCPICKKSFGNKDILDAAASGAGTPWWWELFDGPSQEGGCLLPLELTLK